ncbi:MAG: hypothetical protein ACFE9I_17270 [Candidatus Hermodarchaeota archaeon]
MNEQKENQKVHLKKDEIILRSFPKAIFFTPLFALSIAFWIIQAFLPEMNPWLGAIWIIIFFSNFFVSSLDFPSTKFLFVILVTLIVVLLLIFLGLFPTLQQVGIIGENLNLGLPAEFYMMMTLILGIILGLVVLISRFDYYRIEKNEIIHKKGMFTIQTERFPVRGLRVKKEIPDLFEYIMFRAGSLTLILTKGNIVHLNTVPNVDKKVKQIDFLLSSLQVIMEQ